MDFLAISDNQNRDLCALESAIYMLKIANSQYQRAKDSQCSPQTIDYFDRKNTVYKEYRENILSEICEDWFYDEQNQVHKLRTATSKFWEVFTKVYPDCKLKVEEVIKQADCVYAPFVEDRERFLEGKLKSEQFKTLYGLLGEVQTSYVDYVQIRNFNSMLSAIENQVTAYGSKPFMEAKLPEGIVYVPTWAINEIFNNLQAVSKQAKKELVPLGVKAVKQQKKLDRNPDNVEQQEIVAAIKEELSAFESRITNLEDLMMSVDHLYSRVDSVSRKWGVTEVTDMVIEKIQEFFVDMPTDIKKLEPRTATILALKHEIKNIADIAKLELSTLDGAMVLNMYAGNLTNFELSNYEYSKNVIDTLIANYNDNVAERARLVAENGTKISSKKLEENNQVISEIDDCAEAMAYARFETPFGVLKISNGQLVNVVTNQVYPITALNQYTFNGKTFERVDEEGKVVEKFDGVEAKNRLLMACKKPNGNGLDKK